MAPPVEKRAPGFGSATLSERSEHDALAAGLSPSRNAGRGWPEWSSPGTGDGTPLAEAGRTARLRSRGFLVTLVLATLVPLLGVPLYFLIASGAFPGSLTVLAITGPMHVAATSFFYTDRDFRPVLRESRWRCIWSIVWLPCAILLLGLVSGYIGGRAWGYLAVFSFHNGWLFYHYQRQNFGLASFISTNVGAGRLPPQVNTALNMAAFGGYLSLLGVPGFLLNAESLISAHAALVLWTLGAAVYGLSVLLMIRVFIREPRLRGSAWVVGGLIVGLGFFLPSIVSRTLAVGFLPYAIAHGAQYILMMSIVSGRSSRGWVALLTMCGLGVAIGLGIDSMKAWPLIFVYMGLVEVHFMVDAKVWRLREPRQRAIMNDRFDFLLAS
jgi:hypothetical protein